MDRNNLSSNSSKTKSTNVFSYLKSAVDKFIHLDDSPFKIAMGFGLGVFLGILPGVGPMASVFLALLFRLNKVAALAGSLLTNTWLSFVTFALSVKLGSMMMGLQWQEVTQTYQALLKDFHWRDFLSLSVLKIVAPIFVGYIGVGLCMGLISFFIVYCVAKYKKKDKVLKYL